MEGNRAAHAGLYGLVERLVDAVRKIEERSGGTREEVLLVDGIGVPGRPYADDERGAGGGLLGIHRVEVEIAHGDSLFERDGKGLALCVGRAVGELGQIVIDGRGHAALAQIVVAHVDAARVDAEAVLLLAADPVQVVVDLPLRDFAALRIGIVVAADGGKGSLLLPAASTMGKVCWTWAKLLGSKMLEYQLAPGLNWLTRLGRKMCV